MKLYYYESDRGCRLQAAHNLDQARQEALKEVGTGGFKKIREATREDVEWVRAMGGYVPEK